MILWYKNSFLASVISILGSIVALGGIASFEDDPTITVIAVIAGIALLICGKLISNDKAFKKWWKQVKDAGLEPQIAQNVETAIAVYNKNPNNKTLKKIAQLNPAAAERITALLAAKKS
jgi:hypothetical protein